MSNLHCIYPEGYRELSSPFSKAEHVRGSTVHPSIKVVEGPWQRQLSQPPACTVTSRRLASCPVHLHTLSDHVVPHADVADFSNI